MTDSDWSEVKKNGMQRTTGSRADGDAPKQASDRSEGKRPIVRPLDHSNKDDSESRESVDVVPMDDDARVSIGLNRLIDMIVSTRKLKASVGAEDE